MATIRYINGRYPYPAAAAHVPGAVVTRPDGTLAIYDGLEACANGELISPEPLIPGPTAVFDKDAPSDNLTAGTVVYVIAATSKVTATASGNVRVGKVVKTAGVGVTQVHVNCVA